MATITKRKTQDGEKRYRVQIRLKGSKNDSNTFKRKTDAKDWARDIESAINQGRDFPTRELTQRTVGEMIDRYLEKKPRPEEKRWNQKGTHNLRQHGWWKERIGSYSLANLTPALISEWRDKLLSGDSLSGKPASSSTCRHYLVRLSNVCSAATEWGWLSKNPVSEVKKPKMPRGRVRFLSEEEKERLLEACKGSNSYIYAVVSLAILTGARQYEIMNLRWKDIDRERKILYVLDTKNGENRSVPITQKAMEILDSLPSGSEYLLCNFLNKSKYDVPRFPERSWVRAREASGLEDFHFHDLRHTAASYLAMSGASLLELATILGHKSLNMVQRYAHLTENHTRGVMERMNEKFLSP